jgi:hypothetical protein
MCVVGLGVDSAGQRAPPHVLWSWPIGATTQPGHLGSIPTGAAALPTILRVAWAQTYPVRTVTMVVPFAAGGPG